MARTHAAKERATYAVMSDNNRRGVASGVLCEPTMHSLLCNGAVNISLQQWINMQHYRKWCILWGAALRLYNEGLTQLDLGLSRVLELAVAAENWERWQSKAIENNGKKGIKMCKEDFMCDFKLQWDLWIRCQETTCGECNRLRTLVCVKCGNSSSVIINCSYELNG
jgi:hypothetical protein